jgi:predicted ATP-dependent protease
MFEFHKEYGWVALKSQEEIYFETETSKNLQKTFNLFLQKKDIILKFKKNKRSYLLHSDPGMGKSALIRNFCKKAMKQKSTTDPANKW